MKSWIFIFICLIGFIASLALSDINDTEKMDIELIGSTSLANDGEFGLLYLVEGENPVVEGENVAKPCNDMVINYETMRIEIYEKCEMIGFVWIQSINQIGIPTDDVEENFEGAEKLDIPNCDELNKEWVDWVDCAFKEISSFEKHTK